MTITVRVQEKGQVTIPQSIRRQMNLKKGDLVTFVKTESGVVIKTLDLAADDLLQKLESELQSRGIKMDEVLSRSGQVSAQVLAREFDLLPGEQDLLFQALQLKAQAAVEAIRNASRTNDELSNEEIDAEIKAVRKNRQDADRT